MINEKYELSRQPRFLPEMPSGEIEIPNPPGYQEKPEIAWFTLMAPPAVMLVISIFIVLSFQSRFMMLSIAATAMTIVIALTGVATQIRKYKKKKKERENKYLQFIADTRSELALAKEQQINAMNEMSPEPSVCIQRIMQMDNRLWERTPAHKDFLALRIGIGSADLALRINYTKQAIVLESDPLIMEPQRVALEFGKVQNVPVSLNLISAGICGFAGEEDKINELVRLMLLQLITHHGYDDVRVVVLASEEGLDKWNWLNFLPHMWDESFSVRFLLCGKPMAHQILSELYALLKNREMKEESMGVSPHYIFIVEDATLLENEPINKYLFNKYTKIGVSTIFLAKNQAYLPMNCTQVVTMHGKSAVIADKETGEKSSFLPDRIDLNSLQLAARKMSPLRIKNSSANFSLPTSLTLLDMLHVKTTTEVDVRARWEKNKPFKGMSVPIGAKAGGSLFQLDMHETGHGPHGLVAGTTGSGKSELLQSIIISLAINYHPHDVVFVLIDYKGGGMADVFTGMPHLVGTITNLGGNQTNRALLSIKSELMRRQRVFSQYGVNNIDRYQKLYYSSKDKGNMPPIPHLIMIADEFAELKQDQPDFMKELVSAARVGRSLGVHLILATQKPAGVVDDQIWSNSKFKLCLKVQDESDSKDVIKRPDAAFIKEPGRAYIQVGNDEIFELFQSAYSGADYDPDGEMKKSQNKDKRIYSLTLNGRLEQIYPLEEEKISRTELPSQLKSMVGHIIATAAANDIKALEGPWLPPLPDEVFLEDILPQREDSYMNKYLLSAPIGLVDDPRGQRQEVLRVNFAEEGNLFLYGAPSTGKSQMLKTLCLTLAHCYTPDEVNMYILDLDGTSFKAFEKLPHCGGVMTLEQENKINQFLLFILRAIEERKQLFEEVGCDGYLDYRKTGRKLPAIVIIVDNYFALSETYEQFDEKIMLLAREGQKYGIFLVATATNTVMVRYRLSVNFKMAMTLTLTEKGEYDGIVGRTEGLEPTNIPGRGLVRAKPPLEFQTAIPEFKDHSTLQIIETLSLRYTAQAVPIPIMPPKINIQDIHANRQSGNLAIGLGDIDLQPVYIDFYSTPVFMVAGDAMSGKSTLIMSWLSMLPEAEIYAMDSNGMGLFQLMEQENVTDLSQVNEQDFVDSLTAVLDERRHQLVECRRSQGDVNALIQSWKQVIIVFDRLIEFINSDKYAMKELLERIVKKERALKIAVIAADNISEITNNWDNLTKAIREEQTGILIGSIKEQSLYSVKVSYATPEKEIGIGDGYLVTKNKYKGLRFAILNTSMKSIG